MNFLKFVNSKDIRAHLESIGYECSSIEAAWLVYQNRTATLDEKHAAWQEIIDTMPDCTIEWEHCTARGSNLHQLLRDYMALEQKRIADFYDNTNAAYRYRIRGKDEGTQMAGTSDCLFTTADKCLAAAKKQWDFSEDKIIYISKKFFDDEKELRRAMLELNEKGEVISVSHYSDDDTDPNYPCAFETLWFPFPTPFKKGDILWDPQKGDEKDDEGPVVMEDITPDFYARTGRKGWDYTDMNVWGTFQDRDGTIYSEVTANYMDYEYYPPEKLTGRRRILMALSNFLKGKIGVVLFAQAYHQILTEEDAKDRMPVEYTDKAMRLAGLMEENDGQND